MELTVFMSRFPRGELPTRGFRCAVCGEEELTLAEAKRVHEMAKRLGLLGSSRSQRRRLVRIGNSLGVTIAPATLKDAFGTTGPGAALDVSAEGDAIVIRKADT